MSLPSNLTRPLRWLRAGGLLESRRLVHTSLRSPTEPHSASHQGRLHPLDGMKGRSSALQEPSSRDRATAWLREETPSSR